jgi:hypothetical protein
MQGSVSLVEGECFSKAGSSTLSADQPRPRVRGPGLDSECSEFVVGKTSRRITMGTNAQSAQIKSESAQGGILRPGVYKSGGGRDRATKEGLTVAASNTNE